MPNENVPIVSASRTGAGEGVRLATKDDSTMQHSDEDRESARRICGCSEADLAGEC
jgi:hypothetical protein